MNKLLNKAMCFLSVLVAACSLGLSACGEQFPDIGEHEHLFGAWTVNAAATCTENGLRTHSCVLCGFSEEEDIPAVDHDWNGGRETKAPTCLEPGERTRTCRRCGKTETTPVSAREHNWDAGVVTIEPDCKTVGYALLTCQDCPATKTVELGLGSHNYDETARTNPTCTAPGSVSYRCSVCKEEKTDHVSALGHRWVLGTRDVEPTCTDAGHRDRRCERCGMEMSDDVPALGHEPASEYTIDVRPTFSSSGSKSQHCLRCGKPVEETVVTIPQLDLNVPIDYTFRVMRNNGTLFADSSLVLIVKDDAGTEVARSTYSTLTGGTFTASLPPKDYTVEVQDLPEGYSAAGDITVEPGDPNCNVYLTASVISTPAEGNTRYAIGSVMHDFMVPAAFSASGESISLAQVLRTKKAVVLNFWATWCGPCQTEFPYLVNGYSQLKNDIEIIALDDDIQDDFTSVRQFYSRFEINFPMVYDSQNKIKDKFGITDYPTTVVIDGEGVVAEIHSGVFTSTNEFLELVRPYTLDSYWKAPAAAHTALHALPALPSKRFA